MDAEIAVQCKNKINLNFEKLSDICFFPKNNIWIFSVTSKKIQNCNKFLKNFPILLEYF